MSGGAYGGDEISGIVFDAGSHSFRVGFAGEEFPNYDIPSVAGIQEIEEVGENSVTRKERKIHIGTTKITVPRSNCEIKNFMDDGMIEDWDLFEEMLDYAYKDCLRTEGQYHPTLFSESAWNEKPRREKLIELMFEKYNVPAFFLVKNAVLTAFANGRTGGLVVDSGATQTSAVPVYDGYCVTHAVVRSPIGGDLICDQVEKMLAEQKIEVVPTYKIKSKEEVNENEPPKWTEKKVPEVTESYDKYMRKLVVEDLAHSILQLCDTPIDIESAEKLPSSPYAFPNGFHKEFLAERIKVPEGLFDLKYLRDVDTASLMSVSQVASAACGMCDIDIRQTLYSNVLITGGNSLFLGFTDRLNHDLAHKCPPTVRLRLTALPTASERRFGPWIGGSILASVGTFQQMWISKSEYEEGGRGIVEKKCP